MILKLPKLYNYDALKSRFALDPLFNIEENIVSFLLYTDDYYKVQIFFQDGSCTIESEIVDKLFLRNEVCRILDLDTNFNDIKKELQKLEFYDTLSNQVGKPLCLDTGLYEALIRAIIHQQISMKGAYTLTKRLIEKYGVEKDGVLGLPRPEILANLTVEQLRTLKFNSSKAKYIITAAQMINNGELNLEFLASIHEAKVREIMLPIKGIGNWTINNFLLFGVGNKNLFLKGDLGVINAIKKNNDLDEKPSYSELLDIETKLDNYKSYLTFYLWYSLGE